MAERTKEQIRTYAEYPFLIYIDGYMAQIVDMNHSENQEGEKCWKFLLNPTDKLVKKYSLNPNSNGSMLYEAEVPSDFVIQLNADPSNTRYLTLVNFKGEETNVSNCLKGIEQQGEIKDWKKKYREMRMRNQVLNDKLKVMENNLPEWIKKNFSPIMEQFTPMISKMANREDNK